MFSSLTRQQKIGALLIGVGGTLVVLAVVFGALTLYVDHQRTTAMWIYVNQEIATKQGGK